MGEATLLNMLSELSAVNSVLEKIGSTLRECDMEVEEMALVGSMSLISGCTRTLEEELRAEYRRLASGAAEEPK